jgi:hypothetical protein
MKPNWAEDNLQVIRTLMERSAIYRCALAPIMLCAGLLGVAAAFVGELGGFHSTRGFVGLWLLTAVVALTAAYLLARRQSLKDAEPFWSPPARRITQALLPPFFGVAVLTLILAQKWQHESVIVGWLISIWALFYGCALNAAGFFTPRGIKLFGWGFILCGCGLALGLALSENAWPAKSPHAVMGVLFGGLHLAYGVYLHFTEKRKNEA